MKKQKISIAEQMYRAGIWERPQMRFDGTADEVPITPACDDQSNSPIKQSEEAYSKAIMRDEVSMPKIIETWEKSPEGRKACEEWGGYYG